jgi:hypothetical protein
MNCKLGEMANTKYKMEYSLSKAYSKEERFY